MIASSKLSIPYVIQALPEVLINGEWLANKKEDNMYGLADNHLLFVELLQTVIPQMLVLLVIF